MTISIFSSPKMNLFILPQEALLSIFGALNGVQLSELKRTAKTIHKFVTSHENFLYETCMMHEYNAEHKKHFIPGIPRIDWKNVYIIVDQYNVTLKHAHDNRKVINYHRTFKGLEPVFLIIELCFGLVSGVINIAKVSILGFSASRQAINLWMSQNPGSTLNDALTALGLVNSCPPPINFDAIQF